MYNRLRYWRKKLRRLVAVFAIFLLASCSGLNPISLLTGGGPNIAANVPVAIGQDVDQTQGVNVTTAGPRLDFKDKADIGSIDQSVTNEVDYLIILLLVAGWIAPSPGEIGRWVRSLFKR